MSIILTQVDWTGKEGSATFTDLESISLTKSSEASANKGTIKLKNVPKSFITGFNQPLSEHVTTTNNIKFSEGDVVKVYVKMCQDEYAAIDTSVGSPDLVMSGEVEEVAVRLDDGSAKITLTIVDKTYTVLNRVYTKPYVSTDAVNAPLIIQEVIRKSTDNVESDPVSYDDSGNPVVNGKYGVDARLVSEGGFIEDTRQDGSAFPNTTIAKIYKPAYEWVSDLSTVDYTNDFGGSDNPDAPTQNRTMMFYVDELNKFHWFYPRDAATSTLDGAISSSATTISLVDAFNFDTSGTIFIGSERIDYTGKSTNDLTGCTRGMNNTTAAAHSSGDFVSNAINIIEGDISNGHILVAGASLKKKTFDIVNFVIFNAGDDLRGNGITNYFFDRTTKSKTIKDTYKPYTEIARDLFKKEVDAGNLIQDNSQNDFTWQGNFYRANTYGFTTTWGESTSGFSDSDYNIAFRNRCVVEGKARARALTTKRGSPRWQGTIPLRFHRYTAGEQIQFTSTRAGINKQPLRILKVQYQITKSNATVTLSVEEDEAKLGD